MYDVSKLTDDEINQIDFVDFSNVKDFGLQELAYGTGGKAGQIAVDIREEDMPYGKHLFSHTDKANLSVSPTYTPPEDESNVHTLLVAMPYTTNYGSGDKDLPTAKLKTYATVNFGNRGYDKDGNSNDYQWMEEKQTISKFANPKNEVTLAKSAKHISTGALAERQDAPLGEMVTYTIDSINNKSNTPLFGVDAKATYGPELSDQLPHGFQLSGITIRVNASEESQMVGEGDEAHRSAALSDWYDTTKNNGVIQFQVKDKSNNVRDRKSVV